MARDRNKKKRLWYWLLVRIPFWLIVGCSAVVLLFKWVPVRYTPLMLRRSIASYSDTSFHIQKVWVPLSEVSPELIKAVILAEDIYFPVHHGFDFQEMGRMWRKHRKKGTPIRGCSTISQQTAKNVFTWGYRTWFRKAAETGWTLLIEWIWGKERIMEVYLNVVELGEGIYGIEAAAQTYYHISSRDLDMDQSLSIATCLPSPLLTRPTDEPDPERREIMERLRLREGRVSFPGVL